MLQRISLYRNSDDILFYVEEHAPAPAGASVLVEERNVGPIHTDRFEDDERQWSDEYVDWLAERWQEAQDAKWDAISEVA